MGWFDFLFRPPSRDQFANLVVAELRKTKADTNFRYDPQQFLIERGGDGFINLANLYQEYCQAPRPQRQQVLDRFIRGCLRTTTFDLPEDFADVHPDLLPVVRSRFYLESVMLQSRARGGEGIAVPQQLIGDHLSLSLVYDLPQAMRSIIQDDLDKWGVSFYEAIEASQRNLEQMGNVSFASLQNDGGEGVYISATGDNYDASRLVMLDLVRKMPVRGDTIAMVPNRDTLIITGSDDAGGLEVMCKIAEESFQKPRPISTVALRLVGDEWQSWLPETDSPASAKLHELKLRTVGMEYNDQKELLDQIHQNEFDRFQKASRDEPGRSEPEIPFVASFNAIKHKDSGRITSYCVWSEGVDTLLPETDDVLFLRPDGASQEVKVLAANGFDHVRHIVGDLMQPLGTYPERYRVTEFPSDSQLQQIGKRNWPVD